MCFIFHIKVDSLTRTWLVLNLFSFHPITHRWLTPRIFCWSIINFICIRLAMKYKFQFQNLCILIMHETLKTYTIDENVYFWTICILMWEQQKYAIRFHWDKFEENLRKVIKNQLNVKLVNAISPQMFRSSVIWFYKH